MNLEYRLAPAQMAARRQEEFVHRLAVVAWHEARDVERALMRQEGGVTWDVSCLCGEVILGLVVLVVSSTNCSDAVGTCQHWRMDDLDAVSSSNTSTFLTYTTYHSTNGTGILKYLFERTNPLYEIYPLATEPQKAIRMLLSIAKIIGQYAKRSYDVEMESEDEETLPSWMAELEEPYRKPSRWYCKSVYLCPLFSARYSDALANGLFY